MSGLADRRRNAVPVDFTAISRPVNSETDLLHDGKLRPVFVKQGVSAQCSGSAYVEVGRTKVIATVNGPLQLRGDFQKKAAVDVTVNIEDFAGVNENTGWAAQISDFVSHSITPVIMLNEIPKSLIQVHMRVLNGGNGSTLMAVCMNAAMLALVNAGVVMHDMVTAVSVSAIDGKFFIDADINESTPDLNQIIAAYSPATEKIVSMQITSQGAISRERMQQLLELAQPAAKQLQSILAASLLEDYCGLGK